MGVLASDQTRRLLHHVAHWLDEAAPAEIVVRSNGSYELLLWRSSATREVLRIDFGVLTEVDTWAEAGEQLTYLLEEAVPDAIEALSGATFPATPPSKRFPLAGGGCPFFELSDEELRYGWRRPDGWELSADPFNPAAESNRRPNRL